MKKQFFYSIFLFVTTISFSQEVEWKSFIEKSDTESSSFVIVEMGTTELYEMKSRKINPVRKIDESHFVFRKQDFQLENVKTWDANNDWKMNVDDRNEGNDLFFIKSTAALFLEKTQGVEVVSYNPASNVYLIRCSQEALDSIRDNTDVIYISDESSMPKVEARVIDMNINPNRVNKTHHFFSEINGSTETVSIQEDKFDSNDIDLIDRFVESGLESDIFDNHADEMATIVAGAGNSFVTGKGVAPSANISSSNFFPVLPNNDAEYVALGINTQNHSYGTLIEQFYGAQANAFDQSAINNPNLLHVFSIGNQGLIVDNEGTYEGVEGFANITGNYKMSKNTISVGSVDTVGRAISFVSRGPAYDGRVKPEVVAYSSVGSSNSAALVSGISILLQHQYRLINDSDMPSALVKALLINSADDVGSQGLDFVTGYGSVNAYRSIQNLRNDQFFSSLISQGEVDQIVLNIPSNAVNLKLTLVWTDQPANPNDATALVNDLDLRLVDASMNSTLPWVLDHSPSNESLSAAATRGEDHLNNVEQITIANPEEVNTIEIEGLAVDGSQDYFVAYQYDLTDSFEWDYPTGSDNMPYNGESGSYFRWNTTLTGIGELAYSTDQGVSWILLDSEVDLSTGLWRWSTIPELSTGVIGRMTVGSSEYRTESFTISRPFKTRVGFNCADSLMLRWPTIPNTESYTIFNLGASSLDEVETITDTFLIINNKDGLIDKRFSIQPNLSDEASMIRAPTFDYSMQGVECFVISFFQQVNLDLGIYLNLNLGTAYGIDELTFYRLDGLDRIEIDNIKNPGSELITTLDANPNQGYNEHIVSVRFQNGEELELSSGISSYVTEVPLIVLPNPIFNGQELVLLFREFVSQNPVFRLYDIKGSEQLMEVNISTQESILIDNLDPGIYIYRLQDGSNYYSGRLMVK